MKRAVVLLSGGLDSVVSLYLAREEVEVMLALTFDYGQKARRQETGRSRFIANVLGIEHKVVLLPFMQEIDYGFKEHSISTPQGSSWVPNRNGVFLNIAACWAEHLGAGLVVCGFNREEAQDFPDNSRAFVDRTNHCLYYSTRNHVKVKSYVQDYDKKEIVQKARELGLDFKKLWSCYDGGRVACRVCPSCLRNIEAYRKAGVDYP